MANTHDPVFIKSPANSGDALEAAAKNGEMLNQANISLKTCQLFLGSKK